MSDIIIQVEDISKLYKLKQSYITDKDLVSNQLLALDKISFQIKKGERVGVFGSNGSGKSTLLKILAGITKPTSGKVVIKGKVASILEIGSGFHPELNGRENVLLCLWK